MPYAKKQLEERFKLSKSAVHNRLYDSGLDTTKAQYSDEEIETNFKVACDMMQQGYSRKEVREHFGVEGSSQTSSSNSYESNGYNIQDSFEITEVVSDLTKQQIQAEIDDAVDALLPFVPSMISESISKAVASGRLHQAFLKYQEQRQRARKIYYSPSEEIEKQQRGLGAASDDEEGG